MVSIKEMISSSVISVRRESVISNSIGEREATSLRYSIGRSTRAMRIVSSPFSSKSLASASRNAVLSLSRAPFLRPPTFGLAFLK